MTKKWIVLVAVAGLFFAACKNDKQGETTQTPSAQQDTTAVANTPPPPANEMGALEAQRWRLVRFVAEGSTVSLPDSAHITAVFDGTYVTGSGGCNDYRANYTKGDGSSFSISSFTHSSRTCPGLMGREQQYFAVIEGAATHSMPDSLTLEIKASKGAFTFRAVENGAVKYVTGSKQ